MRDLIYPTWCLLTLIAVIIAYRWGIHRGHLKSEWMVDEAERNADAIGRADFVLADSGPREEPDFSRTEARTDEFLQLMTPE